MPVTKRLTHDEPESEPKRGFCIKTSVALILIASLILHVLSFRPRAYFLCSKTKNIYTVDQNNPRVECISVRDSRIAGVGNFGASLSGDCVHSFTSKLIPLF